METSWTSDSRGRASEHATAPPNIRASLAMWIATVCALLFFSPSFTNTSNTNSVNEPESPTTSSTSSNSTHVPTTIFRDVVLVLSLSFSLFPVARHLFLSNPTAISFQFTSKKLFLLSLTALIFLGEATCLHLFLFSPLSRNGATAALLAILSHPLITSILSIASGDGFPAISSAGSILARVAAPASGAFALLACLWYARAAAAAAHTDTTPDSPLHRMVGVSATGLGLLLSLFLGLRSWVLRRCQHGGVLNYVPNHSQTTSFHTATLTRICIACSFVLLLVWVGVSVFASPSSQLLLSPTEAAMCDQSQVQSLTSLTHTTATTATSNNKYNYQGVIDIKSALVLSSLLFAHLFSSLRVQLHVSTLTHAHIHCVVWAGCALAWFTKDLLVGEATDSITFQSSVVMAVLFVALISHLNILLHHSSGLNFKSAMRATTSSDPENSDTLSSSQVSLNMHSGPSSTNNPSSTFTTNVCHTMVTRCRSQRGFASLLSHTTGFASVRGEVLAVILFVLALLACHQGPACFSLRHMNSVSGGMGVSEIVGMGGGSRFAHGIQARHLAVAADAALLNQQAEQISDNNNNDNTDDEKQSTTKTRVSIKEQVKKDQSDPSLSSNTQPDTPSHTDTDTDTEANDTETDDDPSVDLKAAALQAHTLDLTQPLTSPTEIVNIPPVEGARRKQLASRSVVEHRTYTGLYDSPAFGSVESLVNRGIAIERLAQLRDHIAQLYSKFIVPNEPVALFGVPGHWNLGDSFIWQGQKAILDSLGANVVYVCQEVQCHRDYDTLRKRIGKGTILVCGGGNYGDLYIFSTWLVGQLLAKFPNNRIVQLPQSVYYMNETNAVRDLSLHFSHPNFVFMARDQPSYDFVHRILETNVSKLNPKILPFSNRLVICPDSAVAIGPQMPNCRPDYDVVFLSRTDTESKFNKTRIAPLLRSLNITVLQLDWFDWKFTRPMVTTELPTVQEDLPLFRLHAANNMLCRGRVVLSDRLHASILSLLMGRPFVGLDNVYRKMKNVHEVIFDRSDVGVIPDNISQQYMAGSVPEAMQLVLRLLGKTNTSKEIV